MNNMTLSHKHKMNYGQKIEGATSIIKEQKMFCNGYSERGNKFKGKSKTK